jgi:uncharacterized protein (TIGR03067 family)
MKAQVVLVLVAGLLAGADEPKKGDNKKGATELEGTWVVVSLTQDGKKIDRAKGNTVVFQGKTMTTRSQRRGRSKATFQADPEKKTIDITQTDRRGQATVFHGIYQLAGDDLTICLAAPGRDRPKEFTAERGSGNVLTAYKRANP